MTARKVLATYYVVQPMPGMHGVKQIALDGILVVVLRALAAFPYRGQRDRE